MMTLSEAIHHAEHQAMNCNLSEGCRSEHKQLAEWLCELEKLRANNIISKNLTGLNALPNTIIPVPYFIF